MDPLTQGVLGSVASQSLAKPRYFMAASVLGFLSGMAPDLDIFIRSSSDPLFALEFHRHFTHSLLFIPIGSLLCALFFFWVFARRSELSFKQTYAYCALGYATHALLDACTSYGTQLLWPLSDQRFAWNTVSVIDPLFTIPLLVLIVTAAIKRNRRFALFAVLWVAIYSAYGVVQRERAEAFGWQLAQQRGHQAIRVDVKPSFGNLLAWKVIYTTKDHFYVDAVRTGIRYRLYEGTRVARLDVERDFPWLDPKSQQAQDIERFRWFSNGYLAVSPDNASRIVDMRYSMIPNEVRGLWGIELDPLAEPAAHIEYVSDRRRNPNDFQRLLGMVLGKDLD